MKPLRFACLFIIFSSTIVLAQAHHSPIFSQSHSLPAASGPQQAFTPNVAQKLPKQAPAQRGTEASQSSGLNFASPMDISDTGGYVPEGLVVADVNADGKPDLIVANGCASGCTNNNINGSVGVLLGNGDGTFQTAMSYDSGGYGTDSVAVADLNGDGKLDIVVTSSCANSGLQCVGNGVVGVLLGNGDGTFQAVGTYNSGAYLAYSVAIADLNGDGKPDIVVANFCGSDNCATGDGSIAVLLGNGDGTFQTAVNYGSGGSNPVSVAVADVNGDGKPDVVALNGSSAAVGVLLGNGDGTFQTATSYPTGEAGDDALVVVDINGDDKPDVVVASPCTATCNSYGSVSVLLGNGDGTFQTAVTYSSGTFGSGGAAVAVADVNGDGKPDIVTANNSRSDSSVSVLLGNGDGSFQQAVLFNGGGQNLYFVVAADVNEDGKPDILLAALQENIITVLINTSITATATAVGSSFNPSSFGQSVTFTSTVTAEAGFSTGTPTGTVTFFDSSTILGSSSLNSNGVGTFTTSTLAVGTHSITATYNGDTNFATSTSPILSQVVQGAIVQLSPTSLNFGNQTVGIASASQKVTLSNTGNIALTISIGITGANSSDFGQTSTCGSSVAAGGSCTITVTFTPTASGTRNAAITITDNAPNSPQSVSLTGVGVVPTVMLSPTSLTFPTQVVFTTSAAKTVTLSNTGLGKLSITKVSVSGPFTQTNTCGNQVLAGASCTFSVKFTPTTSGTLTGSVSITDNASGSPQKITLMGTGTDIQLTPTSLNFGNQPVGTKSLAKKITLSNKASVTVSITSISITGTNKGDFAETNSCGTSVKAGASCTITVTFTPSAKGKRTASVSVSDNGGGSPQAVGLSGTGT